MKFWFCLLACVFLFAVQAGALELGGYYENDIVGIISPNGTGSMGDLNRLRLKLDSNLFPDTAIHIEPRYYFFIRPENIQIAGATELDRLIFDRYYLKVSKPRYSFTFGKQRIAWGTGYIWNPTDIFNAYSLSFAVRDEEKNNVEAVRLEVPMGDKGLLDSYILNGTNFNRVKKAVRAKTNIDDFDYSLSVVDLGGEGVQYGIDSAGEVLDLGGRCEFVWRSGMFKAVLGSDYTFDNGIYVNIEYFFNSSGSTDLVNYDWVGLASGNIAQLAKDYLYVGISKIIDEITQVRSSIIMNLDDKSFIFYPQYMRNVMQNLDISLDAFMTFGQNGSEYYPGLTLDPSGLLESKLVLVRAVFYF